MEGRRNDMNRVSTMIAALVLSSGMLVDGRLIAAPALPGKARGVSKPPPEPGADLHGAESVQDLLRQFGKRNRGSKAEKALAVAVHAVGAAVPGLSAQRAGTDRGIASLARYEDSWAGGGAAPNSEKKSRAGFRKRTARAKTGARGAGDPSFADFAAAGEVVYRFGARRLKAGSTAERDLVRALKSGSVTVEQVSVGRQLELLLNGLPGGADLMVAGILRELDVHDRWDHLAAFLDSWQLPGPAGDETIYAALDRVSGTDEALFLYDAILSEFIQAFARKEGRRWSTEKRHETLRRSFLAYRQYRGFVEAVAYSLVLPPHVPLPARLGRYDYDSVPQGSYSVRHTLDILCAHHGGELASVVEQVRGVLETSPPPAEIWGRYQPVSAFQDMFREQAGEIARTHGCHTDSLGQRTRERRTDLTRRIRTATCAALLEAGAIEM